MTQAKHARSRASSPGLPQAVPLRVDRRPVNASGFILTDFSFLPVYANDVAIDILKRVSGTSEASDWEMCVQQKLQLVFKTVRYSAESALVSFISGKRLYSCRPSVLNVRDDRRPPLIVLVLERQVIRETGLLEASRRYHLSPRESETVLHLSQGLTTKEIAQRMQVSPNTVKQFVRLTMSKMRVTTRSGVLGRLLSA
jgi:DNA-binding NarL/FixJ family response regulator